MLTIEHISDTHNYYPQLKGADILIHSGDATINGTKEELMRFNYYLEQNKHKFKQIIYTPGNHDLLFEDDEEEARKIVNNPIILINEEYNFVNDEGRIYKIYGSPVTPRFFNWAFMLERVSPEMSDNWNKIPIDTDILITHGPPHGIMDKAWCIQTKKKNINVGCELLLNKVFAIKPKLHCFGHIHEYYGHEVVNDIIFSNGSNMGLGGILNESRLYFLDED